MCKQTHPLQHQWILVEIWTMWPCWNWTERLGPVSASYVFRCTYRASFRPSGTHAVPGQSYDDIALLSSPVDHHLVMRVVQVGLRDKNSLNWRCTSEKRQTDTEFLFRLMKNSISLPRAMKVTHKCSKLKYLRTRDDHHQSHWNQ